MIQHRVVNWRVDICVIQTLPGHVNINTTCIYTLKAINRLPRLGIRCHLRISFHAAIFLETVLKAHRGFSRESDND